jgi:hypothetical protein
MILNEWADEWDIPPEALTDLRARLGALDEVPAVKDGASEAAVQTRVRLEASQEGSRLWRNNVGAGTLENGSYVRWGLANDSARVNARIKSSDLIGIRPVVITPEMVGKVIGQFLSREVKPEGWVYRGTPREEAQLRWNELIVSLGGDAKFTTGGF